MAGEDEKHRASSGSEESPDEWLQWLRGGFQVALMVRDRPFYVLGEMYGESPSRGVTLREATMCGDFHQVMSCTCIIKKSAMSVRVRRRRSVVVPVTFTRGFPRDDSHTRMYDSHIRLCTVMSDMHCKFPCLLHPRGTG